MTLLQKAELLRGLHHAADPLVLPNAWDCASARIVEEAGFPAIATTSAGIAFSLGCPDGQRVTRAEMIAVVRRIAACVRIPVTADLEAGYGDPAGTAAALVEAGAAGLNIEDLDNPGANQLVPLDEQLERIRAVRRAGTELGAPIVINARTDSYLARIGDPATRFEAACIRLKQYIAAGADCLFVPGIADEHLIRNFVDALRFPLNILAGPGVPPVARLKEMGVARISLGSALMRATMGLTRRIADELKAGGTYEALLSSAIPYAAANALFDADSRRAASR